MRTLLAILLMTTSAYSQTVNNATVNLQGANQSVSITQSGAGHNANVSIVGNGVSFIGVQSGSVPQSYSFSVSCGTNCPVNPYIINQY
jgi:hypothetical protein